MNQMHVSNLIIKVHYTVVIITGMSCFWFKTMHALRKEGLTAVFTLTRHDSDGPTSNEKEYLQRFREITYDNK